MSFTIQQPTRSYVQLLVKNIFSTIELSSSNKFLDMPQPFQTLWKTLMSPWTSADRILKLVKSLKSKNLLTPDNMKKYGVLFLPKECHFFPTGIPKQTRYNHVQKQYVTFCKLPALFCSH